MAIQIVSLVIIARFVPPAEFGVYAIAAAVISLASFVSEIGVADYLITVVDLTRQKRGAALGLTLTTSAAVGLCVLGTGMAMARFDGDARFAGVLMIMSTTLFIDPLKTAALGLLRREMLFGPVFAIIVAGAGVQAVTAIGLSVLGFGAIGLAGAFVLNSVVGLMIAWRSAARVGGYPIRFDSWGDPLRFGSRQAAVGAVILIGKTLPTLITGAVLGYAAAGLLSRSVRITALFNDIVVNAANRVALPVLSRRGRAGLDMRTTYFAHLQYISVLSWPFFAMLGLLAAPVVKVLLGDDWLALVPLVRILCLIGVLSPITEVLFTYYTALGLLGLYLRRQIVVQVVLIAFAGAAAFRSLEWVAAVIVLATVLAVALAVRPLHLALGVTGGDLWRAIHASVAATAIALLPMLALIAWFGLPGPNDSALLLAAVPLAGGAWLIGVYVARHPIAGEITALLRAARSAF